MKRLILALALCAPLALSAGCTTIASGLSSIATNISSTTPTEVKTLADAERVATLVTRAATVAVNTGKLNKGQLNQIRALSNGVYAALDDLHTAQKNGASLVYVSFNAAMDAWNAYNTQQGIAH